MTQASSIPRPLAKPAGSDAADPYPRAVRPEGISRRQLEHGLAEGRRLHGEAMQAGFRAVFSLFFKRRAARDPGFDRKHQPC